MNALRLDVTPDEGVIVFKLALLATGVAMVLKVAQTEEGSLREKFTYVAKSLLGTHRRYMPRYDFAALAGRLGEQLGAFA
jgi:hypothetical protein